MSSWKECEGLAAGQVALTDDIIFVVKKFFFWLPRMAAMLLIAFVSMFSLDVFGEPQWPLALFIHLIPSFILAILMIIAWKREILGGVLFLVAGLAMLGFTNFEALIIAVPIFVVGALFILHELIFK